jgi:hypothetical protein
MCVRAVVALAALVGDIDTVVSEMQDTDHD